MERTSRRHLSLAPLLVSCIVVGGCDQRAATPAPPADHHRAGTEEPAASSEETTHDDEAAGSATSADRAACDETPMRLDTFSRARDCRDPSETLQDLCACAVREWCPAPSDAMELAGPDVVALRLETDGGAPHLVVASRHPRNGWTIAGMITRRNEDGYGSEHHVALDSHAVREIAGRRILVIEAFDASTSLVPDEEGPPLRELHCAHYTTACVLGDRTRCPFVAEQGIHAASDDELPRGEALIRQCRERLGAHRPIEIDDAGCATASNSVIRDLSRSARPLEEPVRASLVTEP